MESKSKLQQTDSRETVSCIRRIGPSSKKRVLNVLKESSNWKAKTNLFLEHNNDNFEEDFIFIDPVDSSRNVAAALSQEKLNFFIYAAHKFLHNPKPEFFFPNAPRPLSDDTLKEKLSGVIALVFKRPNLPDDILFPQLKKAAGNLETFLSTYDFEIISQAWYANAEAFVALQLKTYQLSETKLHMGPPVINKTHIEAFTTKWKAHELSLGPPFIKNGRMWVKIKRRYVHVFDLIKNSLEAIDLGKNLNTLKTDMHILEHENLLRFRSFWYEYFSVEDPWDR